MFNESFPCIQLFVVTLYTFPFISVLFVCLFVFGFFWGGALVSKCPEITLRMLLLFVYFFCYVFILNKECKNSV